MSKVGLSKLGNNELMKELIRNASLDYGIHY